MSTHDAPTVTQGSQTVTRKASLRCPISLKSTRRSQPAFELTVVGFYRIVGVLPDVVPRRRSQLLQSLARLREKSGDDAGAERLRKFRLGPSGDVAPQAGIDS